MNISAMNILILDLDGTLMPSNAVDNRCYWQAVRDVFEPDHGRHTNGIPDPAEFDHVTDSGILHQWCVSKTGRPPLVSETDAVKHRFLQLLEEAAINEPKSFVPFDGLHAWLDRCIGDSQTVLAIATGGWRHSARFKLTTAGLGHYQLPLASSDELMQRTDIMVAALGQLCENQHGADPIASGLESNVTYFGDAPWDYKACQTLGWGFVGIADQKNTESLKLIGAKLIVPDFTLLDGPQLRSENTAEIQALIQD